MAASVKHAKVSIIADSSDPNDVRMSDWNDEHNVAITAADVGAATTGALASHEADTTAIHGIADTSALETTTGSQSKVDTHAAAGDPHPTYETSAEAASKVSTHAAASDPHADRSFATSEVSAHAAASDPHTGYLKESNTIDFLVGTATSDLGGEIVVGATPGGELGGSWASPTVDSSHAGSTHAAAAASETADIRAVDVLVGTATSAFSGEIVVGATPGGELGNTWASPTVDSSHSGSTHAATQAAAEATASSAAATHAAASDPHTGYRLESADHSHQSTGLQGGTLDHGLALTGLSDDDHTQYLLKTSVQTKVEFAVAGACTVKTGAFRWYNDTGRTLTFASVRLSLGTAPTGTASTPVTNATFVIDVNINATTIWATQSQRAVIIPATDANTGNFTTFGTTTITNGQYLTTDIDFIGSTIAGSDLTVQIFLTG